MAASISITSARYRSDGSEGSRLPWTICRSLICPHPETELVDGTGKQVPCRVFRTVHLASDCRERQGLVDSQLDDALKLFGEPSKCGLQSPFLLFGGNNAARRW